MRQIERLPLSAHAIGTLAKRQASVNQHIDPRLRARELWRRRGNQAFQEIRQMLNEMATGRNRCMYCEDNEGTDIEHFFPKSDYPERAFIWDNYLLACSGCNSNYKRDQFPLSQDNEAMLINPTVDNPDEHLTLTPTTGLFVSRTERGKNSILIYDLNRQTLEQGRRDAWIALCVLIPKYTYHIRRGELDRGRELQEVVLNFPFSSVFWYLVRIYQLPGSNRVLPRAVRAALRDFPEILAW
jgi:uncharacterized protein (TIGR02646 family)